MFVVCLLCSTLVLSGQSVAQVTAPKVDTLVICSSDLQEALLPWLKYRSKQGHRIAVRFSKRTAEENRRLIAEYAKAKTLENVLLIGDAGDRWKDPRQIVPTGMVPAKVNVLFGSEPTIASDNPYGDLDGDGVPELAVGRLTADSPEELSATIDRIIRYEKQSASNLWQRQINLVAGVGGFGRMVDAVVENATKQILTDLIPAGYQTSMTFGSWTSPYCPDPRRFSETAIGRFNEGCLFWVYCGHGRRRELDRILLPDQSHRILDVKNVGRLNCKQGSPIAICLSCYTGAHDGDDDCLAEHMMRQPNGPVAVICGTRVTMPYGMSILSVEMMNEYFRGECKTLGKLFLTAKQQMVKEPGDEDKHRQFLDVLGSAFSPKPRMLDAECHEHLQLMQLLGDPLLRLKNPKSLGLEVVDQPDKKKDDESEFVFSAGDSLSVSGTTDAPGTLIVEIAYRRGRLRHRPSIRREYDSSEAAFAKIHQDYLKAHDSVCFRRVIEVGAGAFETKVEIPTDCKGKCDVRAMLLGVPNVAIDSIPIKVLSRRAARKQEEKTRTAKRETQ